ncbi:MAG: hypothetical protein GY786_07550 [Proteobacteria bacterium]|nr:hypothetical protein [Pseudomonadota bacterium]
MDGDFQILSFPHLHLSFISSLVVLFFLNSCSQIEPKFTQDYFPEFYQYENNGEKRGVFNIRLLNGDPQTNRKIIQFWLNSRYKKIYRQLHPIIQVSKNDLRDLSLFLNRATRIYFISWPPKKRISLWELERALDCIPLSNVEIQFIFARSSDHPFSPNGLAILYISSHELLQQSGVVPVYPRILNARFRKRNRLQALPSFENFNLFARKLSNKNKGSLSYGIAICRREDQHRIKLD